MPNELPKHFWLGIFFLLFVSPP